MTLEQVAEKADTSFAQIQKLEKGDRRLTVEWMYRIANALQCRPSDLIDDPMPKDEQEVIEKYRALHDPQKAVFKHMLDTFKPE